jgi:hypothetical protein
VTKGPGYFGTNKKAKRRVGRSGAREMQLTGVNKIVNMYVSMSYFLA